MNTERMFLSIREARWITDMDDNNGGAHIINEQHQERKVC